MSMMELLKFSQTGGRTVSIITKNGSLDCTVTKIWWDDMDDIISLKLTSDGRHMTIPYNNIIEVKKVGLAWGR